MCVCVCVCARVREVAVITRCRGSACITHEDLECPNNM